MFSQTYPHNRCLENIGVRPTKAPAPIESQISQRSPDTAAFATGSAVVRMTCKDTRYANEPV
jgi:hypothetical protein